jgi:hypothetical protein
LTVKVATVILCIGPEIAKCGDDTDNVGCESGAEGNLGLNVSLPEYFEEAVGGGFIIALLDLHNQKGPGPKSKWKTGITVSVGLDFL